MVMVVCYVLSFTQYILISLLHFHRCSEDKQETVKIYTQADQMLNFGRLVGPSDFYD